MRISVPAHIEPPILPREVRKSLRLVIKNYVEIMKDLSNGVFFT
jgi:hypothetical protein